MAYDYDFYYDSNISFSYPADVHTIVWGLCSGPMCVNLYTHEYICLRTDDAFVVVSRVSRDFTLIRIKGISNAISCSHLRLLAVGI